MSMSAELTNSPTQSPTQFRDGNENLTSSSPRERPRVEVIEVDLSSGPSLFQRARDAFTRYLGGSALANLIKRTTLTDRVKEIFGGEADWKQLPVLPIKESHYSSSGDYIDGVKPEDMIFPIMRGTDRFDRPTLSLKLNGREEPEWYRSGFRWQEKENLVPVVTQDGLKTIPPQKAGPSFVVTLFQRYRGNPDTWVSAGKDGGNQYFMGKGFDYDDLLLERVSQIVQGSDPRYVLADLGPIPTPDSDKIKIELISETSSQSSESSSESSRASQRSESSNSVSTRETDEKSDDDENDNSQLESPPLRRSERIAEAALASKKRKR